MKKTEIVLLIIAFVALVLKFFHIPGSGLLTVFTFSLLSIVYIYFGFALFNNIQFRRIFKKEAYKGISRNRIIGGVGAGLALSFASLGILFKFQSWPGASFHLWIGVFGLAVVTIVSLLKTRRAKDSYYKKILKRAAIIGSLCLFLLLIPNKTWLNWKYPNHPEYVNALLEAKANPDNQELWDNVEIEREKMRKEYEKLP